MFILKLREREREREIHLEKCVLRVSYQPAHLVQV